MKKIILSVLLTGWLGLSMAQSIQKAEYFIDTDPGYGAGVNLTFTPSDSVVIPLNIPLPIGLSIGFHKFSVRAKDADSRWNMVYSQDFFKTSSETVANDDVVALEYFIDTDPGYGQAIQIPFSPGSQETVDLAIPIPISLPLGFHKFHIRAKDFFGRWSVVYSQNFFKSDELPTIQNIIKVESFIDTDPGFGMATNLPISPNTVVNLNNHVFGISGGVTFGDHQQTIRAQDALGKWSIVSIQGFKNCPGVSIVAPQGLVSCSDSIRLVAKIPNLELGGSLKWFLDNTLLNTTNDTLFAVSSGKYRVERSTIGCQNIPSPSVQANILEGTIIKLKASKPEMLCNESLVVSIDSSASTLPQGIPALLSWFRDETVLSSNSGLVSQTTTLPGVFKLRMNFSVFANSCLSFDSEPLTLENRNLEMSIGPQTSNNALLLCNGSLATLQAADNFPEPISYKWFKNNALLGEENASTIDINNAPGDYVVKGSLGACVDIPSASLAVSYTGSSNETPTISALENLSSTYCGGDTLHLSATGCSNQTIWWNGQVGSSIIFVLEGTSYITARCSDGCLGSKSNLLVASSNSYKGFSAPLVAATLPFPDNYNSLSKVDFIYTYDGVELVGTKPLFGGARLFFGTSTGPIFADNLSRKGESDFFIRRNLTTNKGGTFTVFGGSGNDWMNGFIETEPHTYLMFGITESPISGDVSQTEFGSLDFWMIKYNYFTGTKIFDKRYGGTGIDVLTSVAKTSNGTLFLAGTSSSDVSGNKTSASFGFEDFWVVKTDANGNKLAEFSYGGDNTDRLTSISRINDNLFLLFGTSKSGISGNKTQANLNNSNDYWAVWIDANGVIQHQEVYGGNGHETAIKALVLKDGNIIFSGHSASDVSGAKSQNTRGENDFWVLKTNATGQIIWDKTLGGTNDEVLVTMDSTIEGNLVFLGNTKSITPGFERQSPGFPHSSLFRHDDQDIWLIELNQSGDIITDFILGSCGFDRATPILETESGDLFCMPIVTRTLNCSINYRDIGGMFQRYPVLLKLSKATFKTPSQLRACKNTPIFVRANSPRNNSFTGFLSQFAGKNNSYASEFQWSNGQTNQFFKTVLSDSLKLTLRYKIMGETCFSRFGVGTLKTFENILNLTGTEGSFFTDTPVKQFAYELLQSSRNVIDRATYHSEGGIELVPGFQITATAQNVFEAKIEGCVND